MENQNVKRFCQSCGMPLQNEADYGTEAGGARSEEYCTYCYQNGGFTADCTMDEMIDFCIRFEQQQKPGLDAEDARPRHARVVPTLQALEAGAGLTRMRRVAPARAGRALVRENTAPPRPHELHTTPLGAARLCKNLGFAPQDVMRQCIRCIAQPDAVYQRRGKNWYITSAGCEFVVNAGSGTIITAHRRPPPQNGS